MEALEKDEQRTTKMITALEYTAYEKRLGELELFHVKHRMSGDLINVYKCLMKVCKEDGDMLLSVVPSERARGMG